MPSACLILQVGHRLPPHSARRHSAVICGLAKVSTGELSARTGFEVTLERQRRFFAVELDHNEFSPWSVFSGVRRETSVMRPEPPVHVGRHADVVPRRACDGSEKVNEALWRSHALECFEKMTERVFRSFARTGQCRFEELATCGRDLVWLFCVVVFAACHPHPAIRLASLGRGACQPEPRRRAGRSASASRRDGSGGQPPRELRAEAGEPPRNRTENPQIKSLLLCQLS